jgi:hypothetical protein
MQRAKSFGQAIDVLGLPSLKEDERVWSGRVEIRRHEKDGDVSYTVELSSEVGDSSVTELVKEQFFGLERKLSTTLS